MPLAIRKTGPGPARRPTMPVAERSIGWIATDRRSRCSGDLTISNGLGWSPDGGTMYLVDSGPRVVHAFKFDAERGTISDDRVLVTVAEEIGAPDAMTVDADGETAGLITGESQRSRNI